MLCSSAVTMAPVSCAQRRMSSRSMGLMEYISTTRTDTPRSAICSAASSALCTRMPQAMTVTSVPSRTTAPLPHSNFVFSSYRSGYTSRDRRRYIGP